ncbi:MAG TPA: hypothetical protein VJP80_01475 [Candidatus Saccharimonadales bacterium]|nr:hypothetical protein [Candidatus Saccharimonadales bacterium]
MLSLVLRKAGTPDRTAAIAGLLFGLGPYATYTHGWVATLADLVWVFCALAVALVTVCASRRWLVWLASFLFTCAALFAKESGVVLPALFLLAWLFDRPRKTWLDASFLAAVPVVIYLLIRLHTILTGAPLVPRTPGSFQQFPSTGSNISFIQSPSINLELPKSRRSFTSC